MRFWFEIKLACFLFVALLVLIIWIYLFPPEIYDDTSHLPSFRDIRDQVSTGDLILLSGNTYGEKMIRWGTGSPWNHVGMVVTKQDDRHRSVWLWECDIGQGFKSGVRLVPLALKLTKWKHGKRIGAWIKLNTVYNLSYSELKTPSEFLERKSLKPFMESENGKKIETRFYSYLLSHITDTSNDQSYYCSELMVKMYQLKR